MALPDAPKIKHETAKDYRGYRNFSLGLATFTGIVTTLLGFAERASVIQHGGLDLSLPDGLLLATSLLLMGGSTVIGIVTGAHDHFRYRRKLAEEEKAGIGRAIVHE